MTLLQWCIYVIILLWSLVYDHGRCNKGAGAQGGCLVIPLNAIHVHGCMIMRSTASSRTDNIMGDCVAALGVAVCAGNAGLYSLPSVLEIFMLTVRIYCELYNPQGTEERSMCSMHGSGVPS